MLQRNRRLPLEIALVLLIKIVALTALWWGFVRDARVTVDSSAVARQLASVTGPGSRSSNPGETHAQ